MQVRATAASEWAELARQEDTLPVDQDPDVQDALNEVKPSARCSCFMELCPSTHTMMADRSWTLKSSLQVPILQLSHTRLQLCNRAVRMMLRDSKPLEFDRLRDELSELGNHFAEAEHQQGALFVYALYSVGLDGQQVACC